MEIQLSENQIQPFIKGMDILIYLAVEHENYSVVNSHREAILNCVILKMRALDGMKNILEDIHINSIRNFISAIINFKMPNDWREQANFVSNLICK